MEKYYCLCGYKTLVEGPGGSSTYEICRICGWEDDCVDGGPNKFTLIEAKENFKKYGVSDLRFKDKVQKPTDQDVRYPNWESLNYSTFTDF